MKTVADLTQRLSELHQKTRETPLFNPVFQLSLDLSRKLEAGELTLGDMENMIAELECSSLKSRATRLRRNLAPIAPEANDKALTAIFDGSDFDAFRAQWEHPSLHAVFTAHPTFLLTPEQTAAVAASASKDDDISDAACVASSQRPTITLRYEHDRAMDAIANAQDARDRVVGQALHQAQESWPNKWYAVEPLPFRFASWVGYDMDGRTDIKWFDSIGFRLAEKAQRLSRYVTSLEEIDDAHPLLVTLRNAAVYSQARADDFREDLSKPAALSAAANTLTADHPHKLLSLTPFIDLLEAEAVGSEPQRGIALKTLAAAMRADGLGMGWIHFRVNSSQLHNAIRRRIDPDNSLDISSKGAMATLREMLEKVRPLRSNFAALAIESSTAIRQFLAMAQIIHHIDGDAPIRMLIAECEQPSTILAALYFSKLFGIDDKVDVSPLFETESALEHGGRFLDALLGEESYQKYARVRGRIAIQTGFSDAGRFVGQIPASLAIERLQGRLADAMRNNGLSDVAALIFNTHGESMGRGAHPGGFKDRLEWPLSLW
ncbi:MAG: phosphoenolpyruvate carboxylase, partial [Pontixanthobacter sp.]